MFKKINNSKKKIDIIIPVYGNEIKNKFTPSANLIIKTCKMLKDKLDLKSYLIYFNPSIFHEIKNDFRTNSLKIIVFSICNSIQHGFILKFLKKIRCPIRVKDRKNWDPLIFVGGTGVLHIPVFNQIFDVIFRGGSLKPFKWILLKLYAQNTNIQFKDRYKNIIINPDSRISNLFEPIVKYEWDKKTLNRDSVISLFQNSESIEDINKLRTIDLKNKITAISVMLGCKYSCPFCQLNLFPFQCLTFATIKKILMNSLNLGIKTIIWSASTLSAHLEFDKILKILLKPNYQKLLHIFGAFRSEELTEKRIKLLSKINYTHTYCYYYKDRFPRDFSTKCLTLGLEHGSNKMARIYGKKNAPKATEKVVQWCLKNDIKNFQFYLMMGHLKERNSDRKQMYSYLLKLGNNIIKRNGNIIFSVNPFIPMPGTVYSKEKIIHIVGWFKILGEFQVFLKKNFPSNQYLLNPLPYSVAVLQYLATIQLKPDALQDLVDLFLEFENYGLNHNSNPLSLKAWNLLEKYSQGVI